MGKNLIWGCNLLNKKDDLYEKREMKNEIDVNNNTKTTCGTSVDFRGLLSCYERSEL